MKTNKFRAAVTAISLTVCVSLAAAGEGTAMALANHGPRPAAGVSIGDINNTALSVCAEALDALGDVARAPGRAAPSVPGPRLFVSGLPFGGAGAYNPEVDGPPPTHKASPSVPGPRSFVSGLPFGGAGACQ